MEIFKYKDKEYSIDHEGFLIDSSQWDEHFAEGMAPEVYIPAGLTDKHRHIIRYIRKSFQQTGKCPVVYDTCRDNGLTFSDLKNLFPSGYLRGACRLAGLTFREGYGKSMQGKDQSYLMTAIDDTEKVYRIDVRGFLIYSEDWDVNFALHRAMEMNIQGELTEKHWTILNYLRQYYRQSGKVPTVYQTCEACGIDLTEMEDLFPTSYHRGAIKIAGLRVR